MKKREFAQIAKMVSSDLEGGLVKDSLILFPPVGCLIRGICFDPSGFDKAAFYASVFVMVACVPSTVIALSLGKRIRLSSGGDRWSSKTLPELSKEIREQAFPFLHNLQSLDDFENAAISKKGEYVRQVVAYALARSGKYDLARQELDNLIGVLDSKIAWQAEMGQRAEKLKESLSHPTEAQYLLQGWERDTLRNLGLEQLC